jgi:hypothetical protein
MLNIMYKFILKLSIDIYYNDYYILRKEIIICKLKL